MRRNKPYEGLLITVEGGDGAGKSTFTYNLFQALKKQGYPVVQTREPGGTALSEYLRDLLLKRDGAIPISEKAELFLFLASRIQHLEEHILPLLRKGSVVLCERFHDSTIAYQGNARHLGMHYVEEVCKYACNGIEPDASFFLDLDPCQALQRLCASTDRIEQEHLQFHQEVRQGFLHLADQYPERISILDATLSEQELVEKALHILESYLVSP